MDSFVSWSSNILGFVGFFAPVIYVYVKESYARKLALENGKKGPHGAHLVLEDNLHYQHARARFSAYYEANYSSNQVDTVTLYEHQVAGHTKEALRSLEGGLLLKPMMKKDLFLREVALYEEMHRKESAYATSPIAFVPKYYGVMCTKSQNNEPLPCLVLGDVNQHYQKPCCIDIKMGQQTFEPNASDDKKAREKIKYPYQEEIGFRITGYKVYDIVSQSYVAFDKTLGRKLLPVFVRDCLSSCFYNGLFFRRDVVLCLIQQLQVILRWMKRQDRYNFYCSSLLIVYDGELLKAHTASMYFHQNGLEANPCKHFLTTAMEGPGANQEQMDEVEANYKDYLRSHTNCFIPLSTNAGDLVQVKIIDLAHTVVTSTGSSSASQLTGLSVPAIAPRLDTGYIHGLETLIEMMEQLVAIADNRASQKANIVDNINNVFSSESLEDIRPV